VALAALGLVDRVTVGCFDHPIPTVSEPSHSGTAAWSPAARSVAAVELPVIGQVGFEPGGHWDLRLGNG